MRVTSSLWVSALIRRAEAAGAFAMVVHRGAAEAGAIFIIGNNLSADAGAAAAAAKFVLYGPAPQSDYGEEGVSQRQFECLLETATSDDIAEKIARERSFDPDIWVIEIEDREGRTFIEG